MRQTDANDTEIFEMMQVLMNEGMQGFPAVMARLYNLAMRFECELDGELGSWRNRPLGEVKVLFADATYHKARVVVSVATFIVTGILADGHRAILAVDTDLSENEVRWRRVLSRLVERGMHGVRLFVSDSHDGLRAAREATMPGVPWQRCQMHLQQNAQAYVTRMSLKHDVAADLREVFNATTMEEARRKLAEVVDRYSKSQSRLAAWMEENVPEGLTVFSFPQDVRMFLRTNNVSENLNRQIKARTSLIPAFPNTDSLMRLVSDICAEMSDEWESSNYKYMSTVNKL